MILRLIQFKNEHIFRFCHLIEIKLNTYFSSQQKQPHYLPKLIAEWMTHTSKKVLSYKFRGYYEFHVGEIFHVCT